MLIYLQLIDNPSDKSKFERLYLQYRSYMFVIANNILKNEYDAEDAVHQAFVAIAKNIHKIPESDCTKTKLYIVTIMRNCSIDIYRMKKHRPLEELDESMFVIELEAPHTSPLADAMARLPAHYLHVILLKYDSGYSNREIAKILGLSYEGVHSLVQRAKKKLSELLEEEGITV